MLVDLACSIHRILVSVQVELRLDLLALLDDIDRKPEGTGDELSYEPTEEVALVRVINEVLNSSEAVLGVQMSSFCCIRKWS